MTAEGTDVGSGTEPGTSRLGRGPGPIGGALLIAAAIAIASLFTIATRRAPVPSDAVGLAFLICLAGVCFVASGVVAWRQRPGNRTGPLMVAVGFALILGRGARQYDSPLIYTINIFTFNSAFWLLAWLILGFPSGRVRNVWERLVCASSFLLVMVYKPILRLFNDPQALGCEVCPPGLNLLHIPGTEHLYKPLLSAADWWALALELVVVPILVRRLTRASVPARRVLAVPAVAGLTIVLSDILFVVTAKLTELPNGPTLPVGVSTALQWSYWIQAVSFVVLPVGLLVGLLKTRVTRSIVGSLVVDLSSVPPPKELRAALARALGDQSLELGLRVDERYVDSDGCPVEPPGPGSGRAVTAVEHDGKPLAILVHDAALLDDHGLLDAVAAAARMALQNARLQAEIQVQLNEIQASRARIVEAADEERRRLERDIHDGAQQRLVSLSMALRMLHEEVGDRIDSSLGELISRADDEARAAISEVRDLARGVHPKVLTDSGLDEALISLADTSPVPVLVLSELRQRFAPAVEAAAYFVCSEALANCAKHARATTVVVRAGHLDGRLEVSVEDDGDGGASVEGGKGLRGLADRVAALGGELLVESRPEGGTRVSAWIPTTRQPVEERGVAPQSSQA